MNLLHSLSVLLHGSNHPVTKALAKLSPSDPGSQGYLPDTTFNPNPNTNIANSSHSLALVKLLSTIQNQPNLQQQGNLPYGGLQGGYNRAAVPLRPGQIPFNTSNFSGTKIGLLGG